MVDFILEERVREGDREFLFWTETDRKALTLQIDFKLQSESNSRWTGVFIPGG